VLAEVERFFAPRIEAGEDTAVEQGDGFIDFTEAALVCD
jgi:hypothetical protein